MSSLPPSDSAEALNARLTEAWEQQKTYVAQGKKKRPSLKIALFRAFGQPFVVAGFLKATYDVLSFLQPQLLRLLLNFVKSYAPTDKKGHSTPQPAIQGFVTAFAMFACANMATFFLHQYFSKAFATGMRVRSALAMLVYNKALRLSNGEKGGRTAGDIVNLQSVDTVRIADLMTYFHIVWSGPFQVSPSNAELCQSELMRRFDPDHHRLCVALPAPWMASFRWSCHHDHQSSHQRGSRQTSEAPTKAADEE